MLECLVILAVLTGAMALALDNEHSECYYNANN